MIPELALLLGLLAPFQRVYRTVVPENKIFGNILDPDNTCMLYVRDKGEQRLVLKRDGLVKTIPARRLLLIPNPKYGKVSRAGWVQYYVLDEWCNLPNTEITVEH